MKFNICLIFKDGTPMPLGFVEDLSVESAAKKVGLIRIDGQFALPLRTHHFLITLQPIVDAPIQGHSQLCYLVPVALEDSFKRLD